MNYVKIKNFNEISFANLFVYMFLNFLACIEELKNLFLLWFCEIVFYYGHDTLIEFSDTRKCVNAYRCP